MEDNNVLQFLPRDEYEIVKWDRIAARIATAQADEALTTELTSQEIYDALSEDSLEVMNRMLVGLKRAGHWTPDCNEKMKGIVREVLGLCKMIASRTVAAPVKVNIVTVPVGVPDDQNAG